MAEGGELEFVKRIIHDSLQLKKRLRWDKEPDFDLQNQILLKRDFFP